MRISSASMETTKRMERKEEGVKLTLASQPISPCGALQPNSALALGLVKHPCTDKSLSLEWLERIDAAQGFFLRVIRSLHKQLSYHNQSSSFYH